MTKPEEATVQPAVGTPLEPSVMQQRRCTEREKCNGEATTYDTVSSGVYSLTLKCRACGFVVRHDWD